MRSCVYSQWLSQQMFGLRLLKTEWLLRGAGVMVIKDNRERLEEVKKCEADDEIEDLFKLEP